MGEAFIIRRGGSGGGLSGCSVVAHIDTGSTVAAYSDAAATVKVRDGREIGTSGDFLITGLSAGTYYIKAEKGEKSRVGIVTFSGESIEYLDWTYDLPLYDRGDENTLVTGGWEGVASTKFGGSTAFAPNITRYADYMYVDIAGAGNYKGGYITTANPIDLSKYSSVHLICETAYGYKNEIGVLDAGRSSVLARKTLEKAEVNDTTLDISGINQMGYIAISLRCETSDDRYIRSVSLVELTV